MDLDTHLINIHKVYQSEQFIRLSDIIGFTGLGPDLERKYIKDIAIIEHDIRCAEVSSAIAKQYDLNSNASAFIALVHDYSSVPFRKFATFGYLSELIQNCNYDFKARTIQLLNENNIKIDTGTQNDILNFDIDQDKCKNLSDEGQIAIIAESIVSVYEDIFLALKYQVINIDEIPQELYSKLLLANPNDLLQQIQSETSKLTTKYATLLITKNKTAINSLADIAREIKSQARQKFITEYIFKKGEKITEIQKVDDMLKTYHQLYLKNRKFVTSKKPNIEFLDILTKSSETVLLAKPE